MDKLKNQERMTSNSYYRPIQYLGAKSRTLNEIVAECNRLCVPESYVVDLFSGSSIVSQALYKNKNKVIANDVMGFCCDMSSAMLNFKKTDDAEEEVVGFIGNLKGGLSDMSVPNCFCEYIQKEREYLCQKNLGGLKELYNELRQVRNASNGNGGQIDFIYKHLGEVVSKNALLVSNYYAGTYFGIKQSLDLDYILNLIYRSEFNSDWTRCVLLTALYNTCSLIVNSAGKHFAQPIQIKNFDLKKITNHRFLENRFFRVMDLFVDCVQKILYVSNGFGKINDNIVLNEDICNRRFYDEIGRHNVSVFYADPPYTAQQYSRFYHIPEVLHSYRYPKLQMFRGDVTQGIYPNNKYKSPFCSKVGARQAFSKIFELVRDNNASLVLSYSESKTEETGNERMVTMEDILYLASCYLPNHNIKQVDFSFDYKQLNSKAKVISNKEDKEFLMVFEK